MAEPWPREKIEEELREILRKRVSPGRVIAPGDHLAFDLGIDSEERFHHVVPAMERRFGIDAPAFAWGGAATFGEMVALVERYPRAPPTAEERARDQAEGGRARRLWRRTMLGLAAWAAIAILLETWRSGVGLAASLVAVVVLFAVRRPAQRRDALRLRGEREEWKALRARSEQPHDAEG